MSEIHTPTENTSPSVGTSRKRKICPATLAEVRDLLARAANDPRLKHADCRVFMALMGRYNLDKQRCWPSLRTLESDARMSRRHVQRAIRNLEVCGYLITRLGKGHQTTQFMIGEQLNALRVSGVRGDTSEVSGVTPKQRKGTKEPRGYQ